VLLGACRFPSERCFCKAGCHGVVGLLEVGGARVLHCGGGFGE